MSHHIGPLLVPVGTAQPVRVAVGGGPEKEGFLWEQAQCVVDGGCQPLRGRERGGHISGTLEASIHVSYQ